MELITKRKTRAWLLIFIAKVLILCSGCEVLTESREELLFEKIPPEESNVTFSNDLVPTQEHNVFIDSNFYAGGGVGLGDINNNGLLDIFLTSNQGENRLYLNQGDFRFKDITDKAGVGGSKPWSTGVSLVDINGNGYLDIYVTNSAAEDPEDRENELFINNGDLTFTESAHEYGLADRGYSIHASFFDSNNNGKLDVYVLNNFAIHQYEYASDEFADFGVNEENGEVSGEEKNNLEGGDRLYRHEDGEYRDVTAEAGIYSRQESIGLGVSVGDLNRNGLMDIYISNDFFDVRDYLYLNNGDGTFREVLKETFSSTSTSSMGGDIADLDNDGYSEIFITDMLPEEEERLKTVTRFPDWRQLQREIEMGYHRKFIRNTLQYNNGDGTFSEIGRYAGVEATDWSWGALMADFNLSGYREIFVANGYYKDMTDQEFLTGYTQGRDLRMGGGRDDSVDFLEMQEEMPSTPLPNYMFENRGELKFKNRSKEWGLGEPGFSHGSAYGDLNGNGALDLVVNNVNGTASVYRNRSPELYPERDWIQVELKGEAPNTNGVGAQIELVAGDDYWFVEQVPQRGFQASVDPTLHIGLGESVPRIDRLGIRWPDGRMEQLTDIQSRQRLVLEQKSATRTDQLEINSPADKFGEYRPPYLMEQTGNFGIDWVHEESDFNDFDYFPLLYKMRSTEGPPACTGDINGNGKEDFYLGGARGQAGALFIQTDDRFVETETPEVFEADRESEDVDCLFFDATGDGRSELYVASGSSEFAAGSFTLADRLYRLNGDGDLDRMEDALPRSERGHMPTGAMDAADLNGNGHLDLFVGSRMMPHGFGSRLGYGRPVGGQLLMNDGNGRFTDMTADLAPELIAEELSAAGVTGAKWGDLNGNGRPDLVVGGEWMPLVVFLNDEGRLKRMDQQEIGLDYTKGWWKSLIVKDLNGNGHLDIVAGNHGLNSRFRANPDRPVEMWVDDFDGDGSVEQILGVYNEGGGPYPSALRHELISQLPHLQVDFESYGEYAASTIYDVLSETEREQADYYRVDRLDSVIAWNRGDGYFEIESLPYRAQWSPVYAIQAHDLNGNGLSELLLGGNLEAVNPKDGAYDAGFGALLQLNSKGQFEHVPARISGFSNEGEIRSIDVFDKNGDESIIVTRNNQRAKFYKNSGY